MTAMFSRFNITLKSNYIVNKYVPFILAQQIFIYTRPIRQPPIQKVSAKKQTSFKTMVHQLGVYDTSHLSLGLNSLALYNLVSCNPFEVP